MPKMSGIDVLRQLRASHPNLKTLVLAATVDRRQTLEILQLGARGILLKDVVAERLGLACRAVMSGRYWLGDQTVTDIVQAMADPGRLQLPDPNGTTFTARQLQIVKAVVEGRSNKDIAEKLSISEETVKRHLTIIFDKTGMSSRLELAMYAVKHGIGT
ncbi:MAG: response regulator transcription factor [Vicinamibacterales bacterium]